jgi:hypothetical protein
VPGASDSPGIVADGGFEHRYTIPKSVDKEAYIKLRKVISKKKIEGGHER